MTDYSELVKALRCKRDDCEGCDLAFFDKDEGWICQYAAKDDDAAAAIEALQAEVESMDESCKKQLVAMASHVAELQAKVERLQGKLCDWCAVCPKERRNPDDCELLGENQVMYVPSGAKMEVQDG